MRSYYAHLDTMAALANPVASRPVYRASAIFPAIHQDGISSRLLFLGYWILKRNVDKVASLVTLRTLNGIVVGRLSLLITEAKAYQIELADLFPQFNHLEGDPFEGSLEIEFFALSNLVFPYPAVAINYFGPAFSAVVHTAQRTYNDFEDFQKNSQTAVPESGFNIYTDPLREPFLGLINGPNPQENAHVEFQFYNQRGGVLHYAKELGTLLPYQTTVIYPAREVDLEAFLDGEVGACKAKFNVNWIFPRLLVGNQELSPPALSITHSYYDCTEATGSSNYWRAPEPDWLPATLMIPAWLMDDFFTNICFYPIYSPSVIAIDLEFYSKEGLLLGKKTDVLQIKSPATGFDVVDLKHFGRALDVDFSEPLAVRVIGRPVGDSLLPARIKMALDVGKALQGLPCNICMNLQMFNPPWENKPSSFKWLPFLADQPLAHVWLMNSSPHKNYAKHATIELTFYRESDAKTLKRSVTLPPHGFLLLSIPRDAELADFFEGTIGWVTAVTNNAYLTTYYLAFNPSGNVGGDHGF